MDIEKDDYIKYMIEKYIKNGHLIWEIAIEFSCHPATIYRFFKKHKIKLKEYEGRKKGVWVKGHIGTIGIKRPDVFGKNHPNWKGDKVGYKGVHWWVKKRLYKPKRCRRCNKIKKLEMHNKNGKYKRNLKDWEYICRKCHQIKDGRMKRLLDGIRKEK